MRLKTLLLLLPVSLMCCHSYAQETKTDKAIAAIKMEGFHHSQVMRTLSYLTDRYGPRLMASPQYLEAAEWVKKEMETEGLDNVHFEPYCSDCRGWSLQSFNVEMVYPRYMSVLAYPNAWTQSTEGEVTADVVLVPDAISNADSLQGKYAGKLKGKIVLMRKPREVSDLMKALSTRYTAEELRTMEQAIISSATDINGKKTEKTLLEDDADFMKSLKPFETFLRFAAAEGAVGCLWPGRNSPGIEGTIGTYLYKKSDIKAIPFFSVAPEHYGRLVRLLGMGVTPKLRFHLNTEFTEDPKNAVNIIAEIKGTDPLLKSQVVMLGAHFDSWHAGTGATDNGAGSAVMVEVMRILKTTGLKPRRTIRLALWGGEEQGYLGSEAYAKAHFGPLDSTGHRPEQAKISAYLNMDNGSGAVRGVYLQGNEAVRPAFEQMLTPFAYLDANHITVNNTGGTDHEVFDAEGIPGFQIIQDELNYETVTHHTNMDVFEYVKEDDMKKNAVVIAALVYQIAQRDEMMPRKAN